MIATFNGGYLWHILLFQDMYASLKTWTRFDDVVLPLGAAAIGLQVRERQRESGRLMPPATHTQQGLEKLSVLGGPLVISLVR